MGARSWLGVTAAAVVVVAVVVPTLNLIAQVSNVAEVLEFDPNTPCAQGPVNYDAPNFSSAGSPIVEVGDVGTPTSAPDGCVVACNSCPIQDIDVSLNDIDDTPHVCNREEEGARCCISHATRASHNRRRVGLSSEQTDKGSIPLGFGDEIISDPHGKCWLVLGIRRAAQTIQRVGHHLQVQRHLGHMVRALRRRAWAKLVW